MAKIHVKDETSSTNLSANLTECPICCDIVQIDEIHQMKCCQTRLCSSCYRTHIITNVQNGTVKINCPTCSEYIDSTVILYDFSIPVSMRDRYQYIVAKNLSEKKDTNVKLCPYCSFITILDKNDARLKRTLFLINSSNEWIKCEQCEKEWCWHCYSPYHPNQTCRQFKNNHTDLELWAEQYRADDQQRNAQRCPKCSIFIEKIDGCDHMLCKRCNSKFCYRCGKKIRITKRFGHDSKYSILGCKYRLLPDRPLLRWLIRISVLILVLILIPIVIVLLLALIILSIPLLLCIGIIFLPIFLCKKCLS